MRRLIVRIHASETEIDLDDFHDEDEELYYDNIYDGFIHEIITQPNYDISVVDEDGKEVEVL